jgi:O-glycosyl hydrolase
MKNKKLKQLKVSLKNVDWDRNWEICYTPQTDNPKVFCDGIDVTYLEILALNKYAIKHRIFDKKRDKYLTSYIFGHVEYYPGEIK